MPQLNVPYFSLNPPLKNSGIYFYLFLRHTGVGVWIIFPLYLQELAAGVFLTGVIYAINPAARFLIMRRRYAFENEKLIRVGYLLSAAGFISYAFASSYIYVISRMFVIACSWSFLYVGALNPQSCGAEP